MSGLPKVIQLEPMVLNSCSFHPVTSDCCEDPMIPSLMAPHERWGPLLCLLRAAEEEEGREEGRGEEGGRGGAGLR